MKKILLTVALLFVCVSIASAQGRGGRGGDENGGRGSRKGPPPEAVEACESKSTGSSCSFDGRRGSVSGTCIEVADTKACAPEGMRGSR